MSGYLLDTNVLSELTRPSPDKGVLAFLAAPHAFWISVVTLHELAFGIQLLPSGRRRDAISQSVEALAAIYREQIIPVDKEEARQAALLRAAAQKSGRTVDLGDALIAGTAFAHDLVVVTRNTGDFEGMDVALLNPWSE